MSPEIQPADERLRIRLLILLTLAAVLGGAGLLGLDSHLSELQTLASEAQPVAAAKAKPVVLATLALMTAAGVLFSIHLAMVSWRTVRGERYPPAGTRVISDTEVCHGHRARRRGYTGLALALLMLWLTVAIAARAHRVFGGLLDTTLKPTAVDYGGPG